MIFSELVTTPITCTAMERLEDSINAVDDEGALQPASWP